MDPKMLKVGHWMTPDPLSIDEATTLIEATHIMKERSIRRLPVMREGKLVGLITERMLLTYSPGKASSLDTWEVHYLLSKTTVKSIMNGKPNTVSPDDDIADVAHLLHDRKLNGVCVVDPTGKLVGILTTTNALEALIAYAAELGRK